MIILLLTTLQIHKYRYQVLHCSQAMAYARVQMCLYSENFYHEDNPHITVNLDHLNILLVQSWTNI